MLTCTSVASGVTSPEVVNWRLLTVAATLPVFVAVMVLKLENVEPVGPIGASASDAFYPFADGVDAAVSAGVAAMIQPGGSLRDDEGIAAADAAGIAMVLTG